MPFPSALIAGDYTKIRGGVNNVERYAIVFNGDVMMQFSPDANASGKSNSQISYTTVDSGGTGNVIVNMTVLVTPTTDYVDDLQTTPEDCLITYVRSTPTAALLYVGETAYQWTTSHVVTVLSEFRVHEKRTIISANVIYKNVSLLRQQPRPRIYDLYDDIVVTSAANSDYSPTPSATAMTSGATIAAWSWDVIENGVVSKAASTSQNPTFNLDIGIHWLVLTVTDSIGLTHSLAVKVAIVPRNFDSVVENAIVETIEYDMNNGITAGIEKWDDASSIVPGSPVIVMAHFDYVDGTTDDIVELSGWLGGEVELSLVGDEQWGQLKTYADSIKTIRELAESIRLPAFPVREKTVKLVWGDMSRGGIYDAIWYIVSEHSTIANVASQEYPADFADYRFPSINTPSGTLPDILDALAFRASGDMVNYSPNGEMVFAKSLLYETTDATRDSAVVYGSFTIDDASNFNVQRTAPGLFGFSIVLCGFASYNTTSLKPRIYRSQAPAGFVPSVLLEELDGIIMAADLSNANAKAQAGKFTANHFFAGIDATAVTGDFISGYRLYPRGDAWVKLTLAAADTLDGSNFDTNIRFIVTRLSSQWEQESGRIVNNVTLRQETTGGDNYANETAFVPISTVQNIPTFPIQSGYPDLSDYDDMSDTYGDDYDDYRDGWEDVSLPPEDAAEDIIPSTLYGDSIDVPLTGGVINSNIIPASGTNNVSVRVSGEGKIGGTWCKSIKEGDSNVTFGLARTGMYYDADGWHGNNAPENDFIQLHVYITDCGIVNLTKIEIEFTTNGDRQFLAPDGFELQTTGAYGTNQEYPAGRHVHTITTGICGDFVIYVGDYGTIHEVRMYGTGTNPFGSNDCIIDGTRGDAFYYGFQEGETAQAYSGSGGLNVDAAAISHGQDYASDHIYEFLINGTGSALGFSFTDSFDSDYTNNDNIFLKVELKEL